MEFKSINPVNNEIIKTYQSISDVKLDDKLKRASTAFQGWKHASLGDRISLLFKLANQLQVNHEELASMITKEMGKPILESRAEIDKCVWVCQYYAENAERILSIENISTEVSQSFVRHDPIGCVLAIMPWNFPFWQVFRYAAPVITAGNTGLLKHAPNVFGCAELIEQLFVKAGYPQGVFQNLIIHHDKTEKIISHPVVQGVTLTGSERAGASVAMLAGKYLKKSLMELGGSNAFIIWSDADVKKSVDIAVNARMLNNGQSCIAAKRFIIVESVYDEFVTLFAKKLQALKVGDPMDESTQVGPLARIDLADNLLKQVKDSVQKGANVLVGGNQNGCYFDPTVVTEITPGMPVFDTETFGPVAAMIKARDEEDAFRLANMSRYGLGMTVCTENIKKATEMASYAEDGAYFINELVKSDPRLPFGGQKNSGYGRELGSDGMLAFVNRKTVYVK